MSIKNIALIESVPKVGKYLKNGRKQFHRFNFLCDFWRRCDGLYMHHSRMGKILPEYL